MKKRLVVVLISCFVLLTGLEGWGDEETNKIFEKFLPVQQLTFSPKNHELDNNDNFSFDDRYICYDTRGTLGYGIENCTTIEIVEIATGKERKIYQPEKIRLGIKPAPGIGAVSFHPKEYSVIFIHGPEILNLNQTICKGNVYAKTNRRGCIISFDENFENFEKKWVDLREIDCNKGITSGAHRGGSHRHEYSANGQRIGCTYDDELLPQYGRTIAYFDKSTSLSPKAEYHFAVLVKVVPAESAKDGDFVKALGDSWVDPEGKYRAFIGTVKEGENLNDYLCVAEIPDTVDIHTSSSGDCDTYPVPPNGLNIYKITQVSCTGIVRGSCDGEKIAYLDKDDKGRTQIFIVKASYENGKKTFHKSMPIKVTYLSEGVEDNVRWHPSGDVIFSICKGAIISVCVKEDENDFGKVVFITPEYRVNKPYALVVSRKGEYIAFNRCVPTYDEEGIRRFTPEGKDFSQIFLIKYSGIK